MEIIKIDQIKTGDTFLVSGSSWISNTILKVMRRWGKKQGYDVDKIHIYSHAARFIWEGDKLWLFGSVENGYQPILFEEHYNLKKTEMCIMRRYKELDEKETSQTTNYCLHLDGVSISYQYWNFIQWLLLVYLGINTFKKDSDRFTYCFEGERLCRKNLNPENYEDVFQTDIYQLLLDPNYHIIYENHIK